MLTWPPERQADVAQIVEMMERQDTNDLHLTHEQATEARRRIARPSKDTIAADDVFKRYRSPRT